MAPVQALARGVVVVLERGVDPLDQRQGGSVVLDVGVNDPARSS